MTSAKSLLQFQPLDEDLLMQTLSEITCSIGESIYLRELESEAVTVLRNVLFKSFAEKETWRKVDIKKALVRFAQEQGAEVDDSEINKVI